MFASWGRLLVSRSSVRHAFQPLGSQIRVGVTVGQLQSIAQARTLAVAASKKKPAASKTSTAKKTATAKRATSTTKKATGTTKKTATTSKKATTAKKKASPAKRITGKRTTASTKKAASKKPVAKQVASPRPRKKKDPEEVKKEKEKEMIKALKEKILDPPGFTGAGVNPWTEFFKVKIHANKGLSLNALWQQHGKEWQEEYKNLTPAELETLRQTSAKRAQAAEAALREWIVAHSPAEIHEANLARARLRRMLKREDPPYGLKTLDLKKIPDERLPKHPRNAVIIYVMDRLKSYTGEGKEKMEYVMGLPPQFKHLPEPEKSKYKQLAAQEKMRYLNEMKSLGIQPSTVKKSEKA